MAVSLDRKSTRLNSSHTLISYAVFCLKKKKIMQRPGAGADLCDNTQDVRHIYTSLFYRCTFTLDSPDAPDACFLLFYPCFFFLMKGRPPKSTLFPYPTFSG